MLIRNPRRATGDEPPRPVAVHGLVVVAIALVGLLLLALELGSSGADAQSREALVRRGQGLFAEKGCYGCHTIGVAGTPIAPDLSRVGARYPEPALARWLRDPAAQEPTRHMPKLEMSETEASALAAYLSTLR
jgi:mono/diheme cytochrome c family protein